MVGSLDRQSTPAEHAPRSPRNRRAPLRSFWRILSEFPRISSPAGGRRRRSRWFCGGATIGGHADRSNHRSPENARKITKITKNLSENPIFGPPKLIPRTRKMKIRRVPLARHKITNQNTLFPENPRHRPRGLRAMLRDWGARENFHLIGKIATYVFPKKWIPHRDSPRTSVGSRRRVRHGAFAPRFYAPRPLWLGALTGRAHWQSTLLGVLGIGVLPYDHSREF